jgi:hypothetical protein
LAVVLGGRTQPREEHKNNLACQAGDGRNAEYYNHEPGWRVDPGEQYGVETGEAKTRNESTPDTGNTNAEKAPREPYGQQRQ